MKNSILIAPIFVLLIGCATTTPAQQAALEKQASQPVTCTAGSDCEVKWGRALQWVLNNSDYKIRSQSDAMIATMGPLPNSASPAFTVTKTSQGNGVYMIDFRGGCDNFIGCIPSLLDSKVSFAKAVMVQ